jgi:hypothetical protein
MACDRSPFSVQRGPVHIKTCRVWVLIDEYDICRNCGGILGEILIAAKRKNKTGAQQGNPSESPSAMQTHQTHFRPVSGLTNDYSMTVAGAASGLPVAHRLPVYFQ